jgi:hypothetical protein
MEILKKILIIIIVLLIIYLIWRLIKKSGENKQYIELNNHTSIKEGLLGLGSITSTPDSELESLKSKEPVKILTVKPELTNLPLKEYCIMGSYNSAITGKYVNLDMVKYVLSRGCRFLDFEVFYINNKKSKDIDDIYTPVVSYVLDNKFKNLETENSILLDKVLAAAVANGFSSNSPNNGDPLFIQLRIKPAKVDKSEYSGFSDDNAYLDNFKKNEVLKKDFYKAIAKSVDYALKSKLYNGQVTEDTKFADLMGKVVLIIDKTIEPKYKDYCSCNLEEQNCYDLTKYVNMESGGINLFLLQYNEILKQHTLPPTIV